MTRKDYELIASVIAGIRPVWMGKYPTLHANDIDELRGSVATHLATALEVDNPSFRRDIFMEACNIPGWKKTKQLLRK